MITALPIPAAIRWLRRWGVLLAILALLVVAVVLLWPSSPQRIEVAPLLEERQRIDAERREALDAVDAEQRDQLLAVEARRRAELERVEAARAAREAALAADDGIENFLRGLE